MTGFPGKGFGRSDLILCIRICREERKRDQENGKKWNDWFYFC